ncbi:SDR family oxidoreductase [Peterkaempfera bronchialis]|uniref:SDR family oxidoreductase n=1 Tax=Peterkaempfera bronchialis TaxID=2126346 RepID=A0A345STF5_9ACTN|nr:SDR family oxidoreductase [Peterkaempfera bronchialis]AXI77010.1 SDR family oxidoreductase [Peterkaempfera bronchialis]
MSIHTGPVSLVTGGSKGIGAATVRRLLADGHRVAATGRDPESLARLAAEAEADGRLLTLPGDAGEYGDVAEAVRATVEAFGRLDHVVANAGFSTYDSLADGDPEGWRTMLLTNVLGPALLVRAALPALRESRGRIVLVGSVAGFKNTPGNMYSVTKWAVTALAENTRMLVTSEGIGVTLVAPGRVDTPFWEGRERPPGPVLPAESVADCIGWVLARPAGTDVNQVVVRPVGQAA